MSNKISLTYENGKFYIAINENIVHTDNDMESSLIKFNSVIKNNTVDKKVSWDFIESEVSSYKLDNLELNSKFMTVSFGKMKYFYNTDKVFYMQDNSMISLGGGYSLFNFVLNKISENKLENEESFLDLCKISMINKAIFSANEDVVIISSPKFNYGTVDYNFATDKINKGTSSEKGSFEEFKNYVIEILK